MAVFTFRGNKRQKEKGVVKRRKCRDVFCCGFFAAYWIGMIIVASIAGDSGNVDRLLYGVDYKGRVCGSDHHVEDRRRIVFPRMTEDLLLNLQNGLDILDPLDFKFYGICVDSCPAARSLICNEEASNIPEAYEDQVVCFDRPRPNTEVCQDLRNHCWLNPMRMESVFFRCMPVFEKEETVRENCVFPNGVSDPDDPACVVRNTTTVTSVEEPASNNLLFEQFNTVQNTWSRWVGDLQRGWEVVAFCGIILPLTLGFAWLILLKYGSGPVVYLSIFLSFCMLIAVTVFCYFKAGLLNSQPVRTVLEEIDAGTSQLQSHLIESSEFRTRYKYAAYFFTIVTVVSAMVLVAVRHSIRTVIRVIKRSSSALRENPFLNFAPLVSIMMLFGLMLYAIWVAAMMMSAGSVQDVSGFRATIQSNIDAFNEKYPGSLDSDIVQEMQNQTLAAVDNLTDTRWLLIYHVFGVLWTLQVIQGIGISTIAGAIGMYYFSRNRDDDWSVLTSFRRTMVYQFGSICFGSFLIAGVQFVFKFLEYTHKALLLAESNKWITARPIVGTLRCCSWFLQRFIDFVSRQSYIYMSIKGTGFLKSSRKAVILILGNLTELLMVNTLGEIFMFLAKALITGASTFIAFSLLDNAQVFQSGGDRELSSQWLVVFVTMVFAYATASSFLHVFDITTDTIMICYCIDKEENDGNAIHLGNIAKFTEADMMGSETESESESGTESESGSAESDSEMSLSDISYEEKEQKPSL